jgi:hypothetical protein
MSSGKLETCPTMVWVPSIAFAVLVVIAHVLDPNLYGRPLSFSRDGRAWCVGYAAFVALILATVGYAVAFLRAPRPLRKYALGPLVAAVLLAGVTLTPTRTTFHDGLATAALVWVAVFLTIRWLDVNVRLVVIVFIGVAIAAGVVVLVSPPWAQKLLIACQVVVMNADAVRVRHLTTVRVSA